MSMSGLTVGRRRMAVAEVEMPSMGNPGPDVVPTGVGAMGTAEATENREQRRGQRATYEAG
jgi:hypothetical protein